MTETVAGATSLRAMTEDDLELVLRWRNHPDVRQHMYHQQEINFADHLSWFKSASVDPKRYLLILEVDAVPLGYVSFSYDGARGAVWGFYLAPEAPKGTGHHLGKASTGFAFEVLGLEKIWGEILPDNLASQRFHMRQGFVLESVLPEKTVGDRKICNVYRYLLTRDAWLSHQGILE